MQPNKNSLRSSPCHCLLVHAFGCITKAGWAPVCCIFTCFNVIWLYHTIIDFELICYFALGQQTKKIFNFLTWIFWRKYDWEIFRTSNYICSWQVLTEDTPHNCFPLLLISILFNNLNLIQADRDRNFCKSKHIAWLTHDGDWLILTTKTELDEGHHQSS